MNGVAVVSVLRPMNVVQLHVYTPHGRQSVSRLGSNLVAERIASRHTEDQIVKHVDAIEKLQVSSLVQIWAALQKS